ncbi:MAG: cache domain-containing protein [Burkholderiaceae bacterium]|nr:cache domain-containing protein [Burkholderiaceae bacterium]
MKTRQRIIFLALIPLLLAFAAIAFALRHQADMLLVQQHDTVETAYRASKRAELQNYVKLGTQAIAALYDSGRNDQETQDKAKAILEKMQFGEDGYFFIYDLHGTNLMHPRLRNFVGNNYWDLRDAQGTLAIQKLIAQARAGGGFVQYSWPKPSLQREAPKLAYVVMLERWGWMLGSGIYLDDVDTALQKIDRQSERNIGGTMILLAGIAAACALAITFFGLFLNFSELRVADAKLKVLAQRVVQSQEEERARLSRDLHDGISQELVFVRLQVETGLEQLAENKPAAGAFTRAAEQLNRVMGEVRRISHGLRPDMLDDLGLAVALKNLADEFGKDAGITVQVAVKGETDTLPAAANTALFRIAQEAMTNIRRHAQAGRVDIVLKADGKAVTLSIADDGRGFDVASLQKNAQRGIGLRNMHERAEAVGGTLDISSYPGAGTRIEVSVKGA